LMFVLNIEQRYKVQECDANEVAACTNVRSIKKVPVKNQDFKRINGTEVTYSSVLVSSAADASISASTVSAAGASTVGVSTLASTFFTIG
jgi:hypothetical protein